MNRKSLAFVVVMSLIGVSRAHAATEWNTQDYDLHSGDFNGDGKTDLLYIAKDDSRASGIAVSDASGGPNTPFQSWASNYLGIPWNGNTYRAAVADFNGDGKADVLLQRDTPGDHYLLLANTAGKITDISQTIPNSTLGGADKYRVLAGDINGDGRADLFLQAMRAADASVVIYANASGQFTSGATQSLTDGDLGFNWSAPRANLFLGDFNGDGKHDVLVQAKPKIVMIDYDIPIPVPTYPPNLNGVAYAQGGTTPFQLAYIRQWSRNDNGADWSPNTANIVVGDFDGNGRADVILQARNPGTPSRLLSGNATGMAFGAASTLAENVTWAAGSYRLIAGNFDGAGSAGVYFQSISAGGANTYANIVTGTSISATPHDSALATGVMPISAVGRTPGAAAVSTSGTAQYSIPFALPPGRNGLTPQLGLVYDSAAGRGVAGLGWSIAGASVIARCEKTVAQDGVGKAVRGALDDGYCLGGNRLRLVSGSYGVAGSTYRTELDAFSRITALGATTNGPASFKVETVDGRIHYYGDTADSRIALLGTSIVRTWALSRIEDRSQNTIAFSWAKDTVNGAFRLAAVRYTGTPVETGPYLVDFQYAARADVNAGYTAGSKVQEVQRLTSVEITYQGTRVRRYALQYDVSSATARERLTSVQECAGATLECLAPTTFTYQNGSIGLGALQMPLSNLPGGVTAIDINGDGRDDLLYASAATSGTYMIAFANAAGGFNAPINTGVAVHAGSIYGDYNLDGKADVLSPISGTWWVKLGTATSLAAPVSTGTPTTATGTGANATLLDVNGDGYSDLVWADQVGFQGGDAVRYRAGLTTGGFSGTVQTLVGPLGPDRRIHAVYWGPYRERLDFNADGNRDFAVAFEERFPELPSAPHEYSLSGYCPGTGSCWTGPQGPSAGNHPQFGDFNGDGKTDVFYWHQDGYYHYVFSTGVGTTSELIGPPNAGYMTWIVADWDGDGFDDAITPRISTGTWHVMRSNGVSFDSPFDTQVSFQSGTLSDDVTAADFNGDGIEDIGYWRYNAGTYSYHYHPRTLATAPPDVLSIAQDGYGTRATFTFSPITNAAVYTKGSGTQAPTRDTAAGMWVVSRLSRTDGSGTTAESAIDFSYVGAREDGQGRGFLGFEQRIAIDRALGHDLKTIETFSQAFPTIGASTSVEVRKSNGARLSYQSNTWAAPSGGATHQTYAYPYVSASTLDQHDLASGQKLVSIQTVVTAVDPISGLATDTTRTTTEIAGGLFASSSKTERVQHTSVLNDTTNWCLGRPTTTMQTNSHTLNDGEEIVRTTGTQWDAAACRVTQTTIEPGSATLQLTTTYGYDAFGNLSTESVSGVGVASRTTTVNWGTSGRFPQTVTNALSQTTVNAWDAALAVPSSTTDPNGLMTSWQYDAFGRRTVEVRADQTSSHWTYANCTFGCDSRAKMQVLLEEKDANGQVIRSRTDFLDRWDRLLAQRSHLLTTSDTVWPIQREYDARGALIKDYAPFLDGGSNGYRKLTYDAIGRVVSQALLRPGETTYATTGYTYTGLAVTATDPLQHATTRHLAAWGPVLRVTDAASGQVNYQYDAFNQLKQATDPAGNLVTRTTYNVRGMRTQVADMDLGTWSFTPNALGEVTSQIDAKAQSTTFQYDLLGRLQTRTEAEGTSTWNWGTSSTLKNIGRVASMSGAGYSEDYSYDTIGRLSVRTIVADATYQFDYAYDSAGRLAALTYPTSQGGVRFKAKYGYAGGYLNSVQDFTGDVNGPVLWSLNLLDAQGHATSEAFGNGLWVQNAFDPLTGLATTRKAGTGGQESNIQSLSYQWDPAGNLTSRQDLRQGLLESFGYDALDRLTTASGPGGVTSIGYDAIGNIMSKTGIAGTFTYDSTRRHAVKSAGGTSYDYDHNGNMTSRGGATIAWSSYNLPTTINAPNGTSAQFAYTPNRARWRQISSYAGGTETTIYVGGLLEKLTTSAGTRWKHLIPTPSGQVQVVRHSDGTSETLYVVTDHLGSTDAVLNAAGGVLMRASFDVHGARRGGNWQGTPTSGDWQAIEATTRDGYTGHEMLDNVNLVHMNGRVFDPAIGRFMSADPFIDGAYSTQGWNRYAYVHGRVMSAADPSGFKSRRYSARPLYWSGFYIESTDGFRTVLKPVPHPSEVNEIGGGIHLSIESRLPHCVNICDPGPDTYAGFSPFTGPGLAASEGEPVSVRAETDSTVGGNPFTGFAEPGSFSASAGYEFYRDPNISDQTKINVAAIGMVLMTGGAALNALPLAAVPLAFGLEVQGIADGMPARFGPRVVFPRGPGAATGSVPAGYTPVSRWVSPAEAEAWLANGGTAIPAGIGAEGRVYVTAFGAARPGGTGSVRIDFAIDSATLLRAGNSEWFQILQPMQRVPIYNMSVTYPPGL